MRRRYLPSRCLRIYAGNVVELMATLDSNGTIPAGKQGQDSLEESIENDKQQEEASASMDQQQTSDSNKHKHVQLPLTRVRMMIKSDPDVSIVGQEALMVITKATEMFISYVARESYTQTLQAKRKTIQKRDFDACIPLRDELAFLEGTHD